MKVNVLYVILILLISLTSCRYFQDGKDTMFKEFKPSALLAKYEYFKDVSAQLDKKIADVRIYENKLTAMKADYKDIAKKDWPKDERENYNQWQNELAGIKASYNTLAAEYNAAMVKFNYVFCNVGTLPQGATTPLQREYKTYLTE